jgi:anti-sigma factor RsiW
MSRLRTEELLAAYAAGGELTDEERASVAALLDQSPAARRDVEEIGALLGALKASAPEPPPASEAVVRAVRIACAADVRWPARARAWLRRRWTLAVPVTLAVGAAAVIAIQLASRPVAAPVEPVTAERPAPPPAPAAPVVGPGVEMWLDGEATELASLDDDATEQLDRDLAAELDAIVLDTLDPLDDVAFDGLLPDDDLDWVDQLDDETTEELERWLAEQPT